VINIVKNLYRRNRKLNHPLFNSKFCVVSGVGRSGTTILRKSIELHSKINSTKTEDNLAFDLLEILNRSITKRSNSLKVPIEEHYRLFKNIIIETCFPHSNNLESLNALCCDLSMGALDQLMTLFSGQCKVLYIVRNGIEVVASRMLKHQFKHFSFEENCRIWANSLDVCKTGMMHPDFLLLRHEKMHANDGVKEMFASIFNHLELLNEDNCVNFASQTFCHPTKITTSDAVKDSLKNRIFRWKSFSDIEKKTFVEICGQAMEYFDYKVPQY